MTNERREPCDVEARASLQEYLLERANLALLHAMLRCKQRREQLRPEIASQQDETESA